MDISVDRRNADVTVLVLSGRLTMTAAIDLRDSISALASAGDSSVILNMAKVDAVDSSGLGGLISGQRLAREAGGDLRIAAPSKSVRATLKSAGLDRVLTHFASQDAAVASLAA